MTPFGRLVCTGLFVLLAGCTTVWPAPAALARPAASTSTAAVGSSAAQPLQTGLVTAIDDPSGLRLAISLDGVKDPAVSPLGSHPPDGRWVEVDVTVTNAGLQGFDLGPADFQILSSDAIVYRASDASDLPVPQLAATTLSTGQTARAAVIFDIPSGKFLQSALFQAPGTAEYVLGLLTS